MYHNGDIIGYNLSLTEVESGRVISYNVTMGTAYTARNLHPYYNYECRVAAYTVAGTGPFSSSIPIRTSEDGIALSAILYNNYSGISNNKPSERGGGTAFPIKDTFPAWHYI